MYAKIEITGLIEAKTGMHIGGSSEFAAIGAVDSPVVRDVLTDEPMIPGSSLKGKMRALLAKQHNDRSSLIQNADDDAECVTRLFGSAKGNRPKRSRLIFSDMVLCNKDELKKMGLDTATEVKFENSINRFTAVATPRQIERAIRGSQYELQLIYDVSDYENEIIDDFKLIAEGLKLLQYDYLGGSGSRGYGKVVFKELEAEVVVGDIDDAIMEQCRQILKEV